MPSPAIASSEDMDFCESSERPAFSFQDFARITYTFWKPITLPIDVKIDVPLR